MMGTKPRAFSPLPRDVSLEVLVPEDHFYRRLEERLDLDHRRSWDHRRKRRVDPRFFNMLARLGD